MKKLILTAFAFALFSCTPEEMIIEPTPLDCDCDRVVELFRFNIVGTVEDPAVVTVTYYTTINDCTKVQKQKEHSTTNPSTSPQLDECW